MIDALYCRSTAVLLAMHVWLYVVAVLYMVSGAGRPHYGGVTAGRRGRPMMQAGALHHLTLLTAAGFTGIELLFSYEAGW